MPYILLGLLFKLFVDDLCTKYLSKTKIHMSLLVKYLLVIYI